MKRRIPFLAFLIFYLSASIWTYRDYGCTWDEQDTYRGGRDLFHYLAQGVKPAYLDPEHNYPYACFLSSLGVGTDYERLHLLNMLFAVFLFWALYETLLAQYLNPWWAIWGPVFLFLTPSFSGSVPANPKDVPFAIFYFMSLAAIYLFEQWRSGSRIRWLCLGFLFGVTMSARIVGFTLLPILLLFDAYVYWARKGEEGEPKFRKWALSKAKDWAGALIVSQIFCAALWPYLGSGYFRHLPTVFRLSAAFPPKFSFLFMDKFSDSLSYPWYYLPVWIAITTPFFILALFIGSFLMPQIWKSNKFYALMVVAFVFNFLLYLIIHPAIYDGLRHYLFLIPILSSLAAIGLAEILKRRPSALFVKVVGLLVVVNAGVTGIEMTRLHPYEYVYFNGLVGGFRGAYGRYETDYWVAGMKEAIQWLKEHEIKDGGKVYKIYADGKPFQSRTYFKPNMVSARSPGESDYFIMMTRAGTKPGPENRDKVIHQVEREGTPLVFILKMR